MMNINYSPYLNIIILQGKIFNIKYYNDIHLIKFDIWQSNYRKNKKSTPLRLCCELWHQDRVYSKLKEGLAYFVAGVLKEYMFEKEDRRINKYAVDVFHISELNASNEKKEEKEVNDV